MLTSGSPLPPFPQPPPPSSSPSPSLPPLITPFPSSNSPIPFPLPSSYSSLPLLFPPPPTDPGALARVWSTLWPKHSDTRPANAVGKRAAELGFRNCDSAPSPGSCCRSSWLSHTGLRPRLAHFLNHVSPRLPKHTHKCSAQRIQIYTTRPTVRTRT